MSKINSEVVSSVVWDLDMFVNNSIHEVDNSLSDFLKNKNELGVYMKKSKLLFNSYCLLSNKPTGNLSLQQCTQLSNELLSYILLDKMDDCMAEVGF